MEPDREAWDQEPEAVSVSAGPDGRPIPATAGMGTVVPAAPGADLRLGAAVAAGPGAAAEAGVLSEGAAAAEGLAPDTERAGGVTVPRIRTLGTVRGMVLIPTGGKRR